MPKYKGEPRFKAVIYGTNGEKYPRPSYPQRSETQELRYLKNMIVNWRKFTPKLALIYDQRYTDRYGDTIQIGRYENGKFSGI